MTHYERGANLERQLCDFMEANGFYAVRSAGSKKRFDVVALDKRINGVPIAFQCKKTNSKNTKELENLVEVSKQVHAHVVWVSKKPKSMSSPTFTSLPGMVPYDPSEFLAKYLHINDAMAWFQSIHIQQAIKRSQRKSKK